MKRSKTGVLVLIVAFFIFIGGLLICKNELAYAAPAEGKPPFDKELIVAMESFTAEHAMPNLGSAVDLALWVNLYEYLLMRDSKTGLATKPGIAKSWDVSSDYMKYTFRLNKGIQFHNGWGELTAEDVVFTFKIASRTDSLSVRAQYYRDAVAKVEAVDPYTVTFHMKQPDWAFPTQLSNYTGYFGILCKKYVEKVGEEQANLKPIGSGPYKLVNRRAGDFIKFEAVANHWRHVPDFKHLTVKAVPEEATRISMFKAGEVDIVPLSADRVPEIEKVGIRIISNPGACLYWVCFPQVVLPEHENFNPTVPWWADPKDGKKWERALKVRKAMNLAIDRKKIVEKLFYGKATLFGVHYFWPGSLGSDPAWKPYPYDVVQAKKLLVEAGYPNGFEVTMILNKYGGRPEAPALGEAVAIYWEDIGLKVKRVPMDYATLRPQLKARKNKGFWVYGEFYYDHPVIHMQTTAHSSSTQPLSADVHEVDQLVENAWKETDSKKRDKLTQKIGQIFYDNYFTVPLVGNNSFYAVSKKVRDWPLIKGYSWTTQELQFVTLNR